MHIYGSFLIRVEYGKPAGARILCVFAKVAGSLQEWQLNCNESCPACRVWHPYIGCANLTFEACRLHWTCYDSCCAHTLQLCTVFFGVY